ncbi:MAG: hypothetical protein Q9160_004226 [Pyrenula sp. 1 TL-2023]
MLAHQLTSFQSPYELSSVSVPTPASPEDILLQVFAASYCHTDAVLANGDMAPNPSSLPHVGCHEFAGEVVEVHPEATHGYKPGDRLGIPGRSFHPCGSCFECQTREPDPPGYSVYCPKAGNLGISRSGGFQQYALVDARQVVPIPQKLTYVEVAPLMCAGVTIYCALKKTGVKAGGRIGIIGAGGGLGHLGVQFADKMGMKVFAVDASDGGMAILKSLDICKNGGKITIVDARETEAEKIMQDLLREYSREKEPVSGEVGLDAVVILPESQQSFDYGMKLLRNHGRCVVISFPEKGFNFSCKDIVFGQKDIVGSLVGGNKDAREMLDFAAEHEVKATVKMFPFSKLNDLVRDYHKGGGGKLVLDMSLKE